MTEKTIKQYDTVFNRWWNYCTGKGIDPFKYNLAEILSFLQSLLHNNLSYSSVNTHKSALSLIIDFPENEKHIVKRFLKGIYNLKPPKPKYSFTWDPAPVLKYLEGQHPLKDLSLVSLTYKLVMLIALTSAHRLQTISLIKIQNIYIKEELIEIQIPDKIKTSSINKSQPVLRFPFFKERPELCVASTIFHYLNKTQALRPEGEDKLIITVKKPHRAASTQTISRWLKNVLTISGVNTDIFKGYSTRHAATSAAARVGLNIEIIRETAGWTKNSEIFNKFYNKPLTANSTRFAETIISLK